MPRWVPTSFTAGRPLLLEGTTYAKGAVIPNAVVKRVKALGALLSRRWIIPNVDPGKRRTLPRTPTPTDLGVRERGSL